MTSVMQRLVHHAEQHRMQFGQPCISEMHGSMTYLQVRLCLVSRAEWRCTCILVQMLVRHFYLESEQGQPGSMAHLLAQMGVMDKLNPKKVSANFNGWRDSFHTLGDVAILSAWMEWSNMDSLASKPSRAVPSDWVGMRVQAEAFLEHFTQVPGKQRTGPGTPDSGPRGLRCAMCGGDFKSIVTLREHVVSCIRHYDDQTGPYTSQPKVFTSCRQSVAVYTCIPPYCVSY
jgi:hypothetical protein